MFRFLSIEFSTIAMFEQYVDEAHFTVYILTWGLWPLELWAPRLLLQSQKTESDVTGDVLFGPVVSQYEVQGCFRLCLYTGSS